MNEIEWRDVPGYEGEYKVSSDGQVYSVPRVIVMKNGIRKTIRGRILSPAGAGYGYSAVNLRGAGREYIHRLVAKAFLGDFSPAFEVNHKDENKHNNHVSNLEWVTRRENLDYGTRNEKSRLSGMKYAKQIVAIRDGEICMEFESLHEAGRAGFSRYYISRCCRGKAKQYNGYVWRFKNAGYDTGARGYANAVLAAADRWEVRETCLKRQPYGE